MQKKISFVLCATLLIVMLATAASAAVPGDDPQNLVSFAKGTAVIDGVMDDCYKAAGEIKAVFPGQEGAKNFAAFTGYAVYDSGAVYLWGHVSDPTLSANNNSWNGDGIEIFFNYNLEDGIGAKDEEEGYGDTGCMQFRIIPLPIDAQARIEPSSGHGLDDEIKEDAEANPNNYYCKADADNKGYTIEIRFPFPSAKKASVKTGLNIGFALQINDAQEGTPTEAADRTYTVHSQYTDDLNLIGSCWQWAGAMGRATFTDAVYAAPVAEQAAAAADEPAAEAPAVVETPAPTAPATGNGIALIMIIFAVSGAGIVCFRKAAAK